LTYVVQLGDNLWSIAAHFGVSVQAIAAANQLKLERDFSQIATILEDHRRQIVELSRRLQRLEQHS
jgi:spore germination protein YaaH